MRRLTWAVSMLFVAGGVLACSSDGDDGGGEETGGSTATGGGSGTNATGGASGSSTGGANATGGSNSTGGASGSSTGGSSTGGSTSTGGASGTGGVTKEGICGQRTEATVTATAYSGYEEYYMVSQEAIADGRLDEFACLIRFQVERSGDAPAGCQDLDETPCLWTHEVLISNPTVMTDVDGACAKNMFGWNMEWMMALDGSNADYGYVDSFQGHESVVMKYSGPAGMEKWDVYGRASWEESTGAFSFDNRLGKCLY